MKRNRSYKEDLKEIYHLTLIIESILEEPINSRTVRSLNSFNRKIKLLSAKY